MCRQAAHRTYVDTQLPKFRYASLRTFPLIPHASGEPIAMRSFERTDRKATC